MDSLESLAINVLAGSHLSYHDKLDDEELLYCSNVLTNSLHRRVSLERSHPPSIDDAIRIIMICVFCYKLTHLTLQNLGDDATPYILLCEVINGLKDVPKPQWPPGLVSLSSVSVSGDTNSPSYYDNHLAPHEVSQLLKLPNLKILELHKLSFGRQQIDEGPYGKHPFTNLLKHESSPVEKLILNNCFFGRYASPDLLRCFSHLKVFAAIHCFESWSDVIPAAADCLSNSLEALYIDDEGGDSGSHLYTLSDLEPFKCLKYVDVGLNNLPADPPRPLSFQNLDEVLPDTLEHVRIRTLTCGSVVPDDTFIADAARALQQFVQRRQSPERQQDPKVAPLRVLELSEGYIEEEAYDSDDLEPWSGMRLKPWFEENPELPKTCEKHGVDFSVVLHTTVDFLPKGS